MFAAVSQNQVWIHSLKSINPMMRLAKPGSRATGCQLQLPIFYPAGSHTVMHQGFIAPSQFIEIREIYFEPALLASIKDGGARN